MITEMDAAVVADLGKLVARHGRESVVRMAQMIRDPKQAEEIADVLEETAKQANPPHSTRRKAKDNTKLGLALLKQIRLEDPRKHSILAELRSQLLSGRALPSMRELRSFAHLHDLEIGRASSRNTAIVPLLKALAHLPIEELHRLRDELVHFERSEGSLSTWWDVIVRSDRPSK